MLIILFITIQIAVTSVLYYQTEKNKEQHIIDSLNELQRKISSTKKSYYIMTTALFSSYIKRGDLAKLMAIASKYPLKRDSIREKILQDLGTHFNDLSNFQLVQMQLHLPDGTSLLRFHAPGYHGDNMMDIRPAIRKIHQEKVPVESFEVGRFFIGFRYLMPIMEKDKYVGCLELGIAYREFNEELSNIINGDFLFLIKGSELDKLTLTKDRDNYTKSIISDDLYISTLDHVLIKNQDSKKIYIKTLIENNREHITKKLNEEAPFIFYDNIATDYYLIALIPIKDIEGSTKAYFSVFAKDSILYSLQNSFYVKTFLLTITIFSITAYVLSIKKSRDYMAEKNTLIKESMKRVKEHNIFLKTIIDSIPYPFYVVDVSNYKIVLMNTIALSNKDKTINTGDETCYRLSHKSDTPCNSVEHPCPLQNIVKTGRTQILEHIHYTAEGKPCYVEVHAVPVLDSAGNLTHMIEYSIDITEKKKTEEYMKRAKEAAEEASYMKSRFLANVSHEIRTPLNGIMGMIDFLLHSSLTEEQREYAQTAHKSASMLLSIVNDILDLSKIESGKMEIESVVFDTKDIFEEAIAIFEYEARRKGLLLECKVDEKIPPKLIGDPLRTKQVLLNLLSNALKFTMQGKITFDAALVEITPTEKSSRALIRLTVSDTGIGIPEDKREAIFESFNQVDASTTRRFGGTGLGLSITQDIVNLMGGSIWFNSEVNLGSTFFCTIPFEIPLEEDTKDEPLNNNRESIDSPINQGSMDILVVEDNVVNQKILETLLRKRGHRVYLADSEDSAIRLFRENRFDLVLMDIELPDNDGFSVTSKIRAMEGTYKTPIAAITAHVSEYYKNRCLEAGMCDYITKPIDVRKIDALLAKLNTHKRQKAS